MIINGVIYNKEDLCFDKEQNQHSKLYQKALLTNDKTLLEVASFYENLLDDSDTLIIKTSGSTGSRKEIVVRKLSIKVSATKTIKFFNLYNSKAMLCMSCDYIAGKMMLARALLGSWDLTIVKPCINPYKDFSKSLDFNAVTPMQMYAILKDKESCQNFLKTKYTIVGGGSIDNELKNMILSTKNIVYSTYGMTETLSHIALREISPNYEDSYTCLENVKVSLDKRSCLVISEPNLCKENIVTNDVAVLTTSGFKIVGRIDNLINSGGIKFFSEEIEAKLQGHLEGNFAITKKKDALLGEKIVLVLEKEHSMAQIAEAFSHLSKYEKPKDIYVIDKIPYTKTNKIARAELIKIVESSNNV